MRSRNRRIVWAAVLVGVLALGVGAFQLVRSIPEYRTTLLIDTSATGASDFAELRDAVATVAGNAGDRDALALRRFGGTCGDPGNTDELVGSGTGNGGQVKDAVRTLAPRGAATLHSGVLAAIDDFSGRFPLRGRKSNRIVVVTSHGKDACLQDAATARESVRKRLRAAGLGLQFRFVGYKVAEGERESLKQLASAGGSESPAFVSDPQALAATLKKFTLRSSADPRPIALPTQTVSAVACTKSSPQDQQPDPVPASVRLPAQVKLPSGAQVYAVGMHGRPQYLIGPAGLPCNSSFAPFDGTPTGASAGVGRAEGPSATPAIRALYHPGITISGDSVGLMACNTFGRTVPELQTRTKLAADCAQQDDGNFRTIPTNTEGFHVAVGKRPYNKGHAELQTLRFNDQGIDTKSITCVIGRTRADVCTASLTYFAILQSTGSGIAGPDLDRIAKDVAAYVSGLPS